MMKIFSATKQDIAWMVDLTSSKRLAEEIKKENLIILCAKDRGNFVIGKIIFPPEVYDAGPTLMIDDFCVKSSDLWLSVGLKLLNEITSQAKLKGAKQVLVVYGNHDLKKSQLLEKLNLSVASNWYVSEIKLI